MALIKCPECGKEISDKAKACPSCGCPIQKQFSVTPISTFKGINGTILLYHDRVEIQRGGITGFG